MKSLVLYCAVKIGFFFLTFFPLESSAEERLSVVAHMFPKDSLPDRSARMFKKALSQRGIDGYRVVDSALLGDEQQNFRELGQDKIAFAITGDLLVSSVAPSFSAVNLPFIQKSMEHSLSPFIQSRTRNKFEGLLNDYGVSHLATLCLGARYLTSNSKISTVDDLGGLKLRLPNDPIWSMSWQALGAETINIPFPELPAALSSGQVDAQENPPTLIRASGIYKVQSFLVETQHYHQRQFILASAAYLDSLELSIRQKIKEAAESVGRQVCKQAKLQEEDDIAWLTSAGGMELISFDNSGVKNRIQTIYNERLTYNTDPDVRQILGID